MKFSYPTVASPSTEVEIDNAKDTLPHSRGLRVYQVAFDTDAGEQLVYDWGDSSRTFTVRIRLISESEKDALVSFYQTTVNGRATAWQFQDALGDTYDVRFAQDVFEPLMNRPGFWDLDVTLREV